MEKYNFDEWATWLMIGGAGMLGRLTYHARLVQVGRRKPLSWALIWDVPVALCMGWIALGIGEYFHLHWRVMVSLALAIAYLGPYSIDAVFARWLASPEEKESKK